MNKEKHYFTDEVHGFRVRATTKAKAWGIIQTACNDRQITVPTLKQIKKL